MNELWVEKYRPKTIDGYVFVDDNQRQQVEAWIRDQSIPNLLFSGSPGTGKTTLGKMLINELGVDEYDVLYANGSKEGRKIEWVDKTDLVLSDHALWQLQGCIHRRSRLLESQ